MKKINKEIWWQPNGLMPYRGWEMLSIWLGRGVLCQQMTNSESNDKRNWAWEDLGKSTERPVSTRASGRIGLGRLWEQGEGSGSSGKWGRARREGDAAREGGWDQLLSSQCFLCVIKSLEVLNREVTWMNLYFLKREQQNSSCCVRMGCRG